MIAKRDPRRFDDLFRFFGPISVRRMFGGEGIFTDGLMIGLVWDDRLFLRTDTNSRPAFVAEGSKPFLVHRGRKRIETAYYTVPERLYDEPEELGEWAREAHTAALAKSALKKKTTKSRVTSR